MKKEIILKTLGEWFVEDFFYFFRLFAFLVFYFMGLYGVGAFLCSMLVITLSNLGVI